MATPSPEQKKSAKHYPFPKIEPKWQKFWLKNKTFKAEDFSKKPKYYILDMFPYPSGAGLHVGHPEGYTATDIIARYKRMLGFNVLHPMGWDAFGLPAEQYAIESGTHPRTTTQKNINKFREQIRRFGFPVLGSFVWTQSFAFESGGFPVAEGSNRSISGSVTGKLSSGKSDAEPSG